MNLLSLFSGVGGFDYGLENAGMKTVFQCEIDKHCTKILMRHWPDVPRWQDIQTLTGKYVLEKAQVVDVVAWGSPCQDLSLAGKRAGLTGDQSNLFHEGIRIIKEMRQESNGQYPRISIWENVMGSLSSNGGADFGRVIDEMAEAGALVIEWRCLDAKYFGVPQRRRRVFVIAVFDPAISRECPDPILPLRRGLHWYSKTSAAQREGASTTLSNSVARAIEPPIYLDRSAINQGVNAQFDTYISDAPTIPTLTAQGPGAVATQDSIFAFDTQFGSNANVTEDIAPTLKASQQSPSVAYLMQKSVSDGKPVLELTDSKLKEVSPKLTVRRLTPLECERLMGWPDNWTEGQTDGHRYRQCGNGVASPVAEWIGEQIIKILESHEPTEQ